MRAITLAAVVVILWLAANGKLIALWDAVTRGSASSGGGR